MNHNIIPAKKISFIPIIRLHTFIPIGDEVQIGSFSQLEIPLKRGTVTYSINRSQKKGGEVYEISVNCSVKPTLVPGLPGILLVERCDGTTLVLGDPEIPLFMNTILTNDGQSLVAALECGHFPYLLKS